jgi:hypothetical protein
MCTSSFLCGLVRKCLRGMYYNILKQEPTSDIRIDNH